MPAKALIAGSRLSRYNDLVHRMRRLPLLVFIVGLCLSLVILACSFLFLNPEECPTGYTEQQMKESGCIIGANIGLGLGIFASIAMGILTIAASLTLLLLHKLGFSKNK